MPTEEMVTLANLLSNKEELSPELQRYKVVGKSYTRLAHPLLYAVMYNPDLNAVYNASLQHKAEAVAQARAAKNWRRLVFLYERPWRIFAFSQVMAALSDVEYWRLLGAIWSDSENIAQYGEMIPKLFGSDRKGRQNMMFPREQQFLASLPDEVVVYRGHYKQNKKGWSWSLSYSKAYWFASRMGAREPQIVRGVVKKENILAVLMRRGEFECIVDPANVKMRVFDSTKWVSVYLLSVATDDANVNLIQGFSHHGVQHWTKVDWNVQQLCKLVPEADLEVCRHFAYLHDCRRIDENADPQHGERAAIYVISLWEQKLLDLTKEQLSKLLDAIREHEHGKVSSDATIGVCWDADRLDLTRVGIAPDPQLLSTPAAKSLVWKV